MVEPYAVAVMSRPLVRVFVLVAAARREKKKFVKLDHKVEIPVELNMAPYTSAKG